MDLKTDFYLACSYFAEQSYCSFCLGSAEGQMDNLIDNQLIYKKGIPK